MREELLTPLHKIEAALLELLSETDLTLEQEQVTQAMQAVNNDLLSLIISVPDLTWGGVRELLSFEARSSLASIIGYAELLLDEAETGPINRLTHRQQTCVHTVRAQGKSLLSRLMKLENSADA